MTVCTAKRREPVASRLATALGVIPAGMGTGTYVGIGASAGSQALSMLLEPFNAKDLGPDRLLRSSREYRYVGQLFKPPL